MRLTRRFQSESIAPGEEADRGGVMEAARVPARTFDHLREHSIGLPQVLFQSITHMAPGAAVAYSIYISVPFSRQGRPPPLPPPPPARTCAAAPGRPPPPPP